jgi:hypothetical protein
VFCDAECPRERPGQRDPLRAEEGLQLEPVEPGGLEVGSHVGDPVLPRVQVEDELLLGVGRDVTEEGAPVVRGPERSTPA